MIELLDENGNELTLPNTQNPAQYLLPANAIVRLKNGETIEIGRGYCPYASACFR